MAVAQVWKSSKFTIERNQGKAPGTVIFRLSGPFTARDMHGALSPDALRNTFEAEERNEPHAISTHAPPYSGPDGGPPHGLCGGGIQFFDLAPRLLARLLVRERRCR